MTCVGDCMGFDGFRGRESMGFDGSRGLQISLSENMLYMVIY